MKTLFLFIIMTSTVLANTKLSKIQQLITSTESPVVIFDLDDTLFYSSSRSFIIFREFINSDELKKKLSGAGQKITEN